MTLCSLNHFWGPLLDLLQYAHLCLGLAGPELDMILQMCLTSDKQRGRIGLPQPAGSALPKAVGRLLAHFATEAR